MNGLMHIIYKIMPFISSTHASFVKNEIDNHRVITKESTIALLLKIDEIIEPYKKSNQVVSSRQNWICEQMVKYFDAQRLEFPTSLIDIGGGNGNVIHYFATKYKLPKQNCMCIENNPMSEQVNSEFQYLYSHTNTINYVFLDTDANDYKNVLIHTNQVQVDCIICMVSLHHMTDEYILTIIFPLIQANLKKGGYLIVKEHNANNPATTALIQWEHYLYYLTEQPEKRTVEELEYHLEHSIGNYKSRETYQQWIETHCECHCIHTLNNIFEHGILDKTPSKLYWQIFQKK